MKGWLMDWMADRHSSDGVDEQGEVDERGRREGGCE